MENWSARTFSLVKIEAEAFHFRCAGHGELIGIDGIFTFHRIYGFGGVATFGSLVADDKAASVELRCIAKVIHENTIHNNFRTNLDLVFSSEFLTIEPVATVDTQSFTTFCVGNRVGCVTERGANLCDRYDSTLNIYPVSDVAGGDYLKSFAYGVRI